MKKSMIFSGCLAAILLGSVLAGCGDNSTGTPDNTGTVTSAQPVEETVHYSDSVTMKDYGGETLTIYSANNINAMVNPCTINYAEDETGEIVNDTLFARDLWINEKFNVKLNFVLDGELAAWQMPGYLNGLIMAGDTTYDLFLQDVAKVAKGCSTAGTTYPMNFVDGIDLSAPYWFPEVNEELKIGDNLYIAASAINPRFYGAAYLIMFNKQMAQDLDIENMYDLVKNGTWTVDKMFEISQIAYNDMNGDGKYTEEDRYGFGWGTLAPETFVLGADCHYISNEKGSLVCHLGSSKLVDFCQKIYGYLHLPSCVLDGDETINAGTILEAGNFLFWNPATVEVQEYRDFTWDFGLLPMPKYDQSQKEYVTYSQPWVVSAPVVPVTLTGDRLSMVGTVLNAMAAYGYDYIRPAVFDNVVTTKGVRDEESAEIVSKIYDKVTFELATIFSIGNFAGFYVDDAGAGIASYYAAQQAEIDAAMQDVLDNYNAIADNLR